MASLSSRILMVFVFIFFFQSHSVLSFSPGRIPDLFRYRRQICADGTYKHDNQTCCLCASGQKLTKHCTNQGPDSTVCDFCEHNTYNPNPNSKMSCEPCRSCEQPNANLEVEETCTPQKNAKCRCKKDHYCNSETEPCKICQPCDTCGSAGVKEPCTATSNTVCNEESNHGGVIAAVIVGLIAIVSVVGGVGFIFWKKSRERKDSTDSQIGDPDPAIEQLMSKRVPEVDILPHVPAIAEKLGWKVMKDIATETGITETAIENIKLSYPQNSEEWTQELLKKWGEMKSKAALPDLIQVLRNKGKNNTADSIMEILNKPNSA